MKRTIYVASSWNNPQHPSVVQELRHRGHEVYDFRHPRGRDDRSVWKELHIKKETVYGEEMVDLLDTPFARARFQEHLEAMHEADVCILLLPCGRSAHIEAGFLGSVFDELKPELMYLTFDAFFPLYEPLFDLLDDEDDD